MPYDVVSTADGRREITLPRSARAIYCIAAITLSSIAFAADLPNLETMLDLPESGQQPGRIDFANLPRLPCRHAVISDVRDRDGQWVGNVTMPDRFRLEAIGPDRVAGVWRDAYDVEHIRVYALRRDGG